MVRAGSAPLRPHELRGAAAVEGPRRGLDHHHGAALRCGEARMVQLPKPNESAIHTASPSQCGHRSAFVWQLTTHAPA